MGRGYKPGAGAEPLGRSLLVKHDDGKEYPMFRVEISSASHPFYTGTEKVIDLFCGIGTIALTLAPRARDVRGPRPAELPSGLRDGAVHDPSVLRAGRDLLVTWWTDDVGEGAQPRRELRATFVGAEAPNQPVIVLNENIDSWSDAVPVLIGEALPLWVVHGVQPDGSKELRYVGTIGSQALELARSPSPYMLRTAAARPRAGELVVTGFEYEDNRFVFSLLLTHRVECQRTS